MSDSIRVRTDFGQQKQSREETIVVWPELHWKDWRDTQATLHLWTQVIGKIRLALATRINHWWHATLYPTSRGLTTSPMPYGNRMLQIDFDFLSHQLIFQTNDGLKDILALAPMPVSEFYAQVMEQMQALEMPVTINTRPSEIPNAIPFELDHQHSAYDGTSVTRFWKILLQAERVMTQFRGRFIGKVSPIHFFWGGFDLAVTRFSGRRAPKHTSVPDTPDYVVQTAYSHEVSSLGFWPGGPGLEEAVFYAYAYPTPPRFSQAPVHPKEAYFHEGLGEFILSYDAVRRAPVPDQALLAFAQSTYEAAANLALWNRSELEAQNGHI
jgi:hypothetical protein